MYIYFKINQLNKYNKIYIKINVYCRLQLEKNKVNIAKKKK